MMDQRPRSGQAAMERFIKDEIARNYRSLKKFLTKNEITDSTFYRVVADSPVIGADQFRYLEGALGIPRYTLDYILDRNLPALERAGLDADQLRALREMLSADQPTAEKRKAG